MPTVRDASSSFAAGSPATLTNYGQQPVALAIASRPSGPFSPVGVGLETFGVDAAESVLSPLDAGRGDVHNTGSSGPTTYPVTATDTGATIGSSVAITAAPVVTGSAFTVSGTTPALRAGAVSVDPKSTASTTHVITKPAGIQVGDVLVLAINVGSNFDVNGGTTGWTADAGPITFNASKNLRTYYRVVDGTEPSTWTFNLSGSAKSGSVCAAYTGIDTTTSIDTTSTTAKSDASNATLTSAAITTLHANALVIYAAGVDADTASTIGTFTSMTERGQAAGARVSLDDALQASAGTFASRTTTQTTALAYGVISMALRAGVAGGLSSSVTAVRTTGVSGTGASIGSSVAMSVLRPITDVGYAGGAGGGAITTRATATADTGVNAAQTVDITIPSATQAGDLLLVLVSSGTHQTATISTIPSGYTLYDDQTYNTAGSANSGAIYYRFADSGDPGTIETWGMSSATGRWAVGMLVLAGVDQINPLDAVTAPTDVLPSAATTALSFPSITPNTAGDLLLAIASIRITNTTGTAPTYTPPSAPVAMSQLLEDHTTSTTTQNGGLVIFGAAYTSGATGAMSATVNTNVSYVGMSAVVKAGAAGDYVTATKNAASRSITNNDLNISDSVAARVSGRGVVSNDVSIGSSVVEVEAYTRVINDYAFTIGNTVSDSWNRTVSSGWGTPSLPGNATGWTQDAGTLADFSVTNGTGAQVVMGAGSTHRMLLGVSRSGTVTAFEPFSFPTATSAGTGYQFAIGLRSQNAGNPQNLVRGVAVLDGNSNLTSQVQQNDAGTLSSLGQGTVASGSSGGGVIVASPYTAGDVYMLKVMTWGGEGGTPVGIAAKCWKAANSEPAAWTDMGYAFGTPATFVSGDLSMTFFAAAATAGTTITLPGSFALFDQTGPNSSAVRSLITTWNVTATSTGVTVGSTVAVLVNRLISTAGSTISSSAVAGPAPIVTGAGVTIGSSVAAGPGRAVTGAGTTIGSAVAITAGRPVTTTGTTIASSVTVIARPGITSTGTTISDVVAVVHPANIYSRGFYGSVGPGVAVRGSSLIIDDASGFGEVATIEPSSVQAGDLLVTLVFTGNAANTATITFAGGSYVYSYNTLRALAYNAAAQLTGAAAYYRFATAQDATANGGLPNEESWDLSDTTVPFGALLVVLSGVDQFTPFDVSTPSDVLPSAASTTVTFPGVTPIDVGAYLLLLAAIRTTDTAGARPTWTAPSVPVSLPKITDDYSGHTGSNNAGAVAFGGTYNSTQPTGQITATPSIPVSWVGVTVLVKAAEGDPGSVGIARVRNPTVTNTDTTIGSSVGVAVARAISTSGATVGSSVAIAANRLVSDTGTIIGSAVATSRTPTITSTGDTIGSSVAVTVNRPITETGVTVTSTVVAGPGPGVTTAGTTVGSSVAILVNRLIMSTGVTISDSPAISSGNNMGVTDAGSSIASTVTILVNRPITQAGVTVGSSVAVTATRPVADTGVTVGSSVATTRLPTVTSTGTTVGSSVQLVVNRPITQTGVTIGSSVAAQRVAFANPTATGATISGTISLAVLPAITSSGATITDAVGLSYIRGPVDNAFSLVNQATDLFDRNVTGAWGTLGGINAVAATGWTIDAGSAGDYSVTNGLGAQVVMAAGSTHRIRLGVNLADTDIFMTLSLPTAASAGTGYRLLVGARSQNTGSPQNMLLGEVCLTSAGTLTAQVETDVADTLYRPGHGPVSLGTYTAGDVYDFRLAVAGGSILCKLWKLGPEPVQWTDMGVLRGTAAGWARGDITLTFLADAATAGTTITIPSIFVRQAAPVSTVSAVFSSTTRTIRNVDNFDLAIDSSVQATITRAVTTTGATIGSSIAGHISPTISDALSLGSYVTPRTTRPITDTGTTVGSTIQRGVARQVASTGATITDSVTVPTRGPSYTITTAGASIGSSLRLALNRQVADTGTVISDAVTSNVARQLAITSNGASITSALQRLVLRRITDTLTISDAVVTTQFPHIAVTSTGTVVASSVQELILRLVLDSGATISDAVRSSRFAVNPTSSGVIIGDTVTAGRVRLANPTSSGATIGSNVTVTIIITARDFIVIGSTVTATPTYPTGHIFDVGATIDSFVAAFFRGPARVTNGLTTEQALQATRATVAALRSGVTTVIGASGLTTVVAIRRGRTSALRRGAMLTSVEPLDQTRATEHPLRSGVVAR